MFVHMSMDMTMRVETSIRGHVCMGMRMRIDGLCPLCMACVWPVYSTHVFKHINRHLDLHVFHHVYRYVHRHGWI